MSALITRIELYNKADISGKTPLMLAAAQGWNDLVKALLDGDADPRAVDKSGKSAADYAEAAGLRELANVIRLAPPAPVH